MRKRTEKHAAKETPKQRKARVRRVRYDARSLAMCNILEFWHECSIAACRRNQTCRGDMHALLHAALAERARRPHGFCPRVP